MYEMQRPRLVSRHRPADFSASFAPLDHLPGPGTLPRCSGRPDHRVARGLPVPRLRTSSLPTGRGFPQPGGAENFHRRWLRAFFSPNDRGFPQAKRLKSSLRRWLRAFFPHHDSEFPLRHSLKSLPFADGPELSSPHITRGFPSATHFEVFPEPGGSGFPLAGFPLTGRHQAFPETRGPRGCLIPGGPGVSPAPLAWSFLRASGAGRLLAARPEVALCRVARGFPFAGYRPWW